MTACIKKVKYGLKEKVLSLHFTRALSSSLELACFVFLSGGESPGSLCQQLYL